MARRRRPSRRYGQLVARIAAPAAFLLAATIAVLLVRAALRDESQPPPRATTAVTTTAANQRPARGRPRTDRQAGNVYVVQSGDTFGTIADAHGTSVARLVQLNPRVNPRALTVGQRIRVP